MADEKATLSKVVIGLLGVAIGASIGPCLTHHLHKQSDLQLVGQNIYRHDGELVLGFQVWNRSDNSQPLSNVTYSLTPIVDNLTSRVALSSEWKGQFQIAVVPMDGDWRAAVKEKGSKWTARGSFVVGEKGSWTMKFDSGLSAIVPANEHRLVLVGIPEKVAVVGSKDNKEEVHLLSILSEAFRKCKCSVEAKIECGGGVSIEHKGSLSPY